MKTKAPLKRTYSPETDTYQNHRTPADEESIRVITPYEPYLMFSYNLREAGYNVMVYDKKVWVNGKSFDSYTELFEYGSALLANDTEYQKYVDQKRKYHTKRRLPKLKPATFKEYLKTRRQRVLILAGHKFIYEDTVWTVNSRFGAFDEGWLCYDNNRNVKFFNADIVTNADIIATGTPIKRQGRKIYYAD